MKVYLVIAITGNTPEAWPHILKAFSDKGRAEKYIEELKPFVEEWTEKVNKEYDRSLRDTQPNDDFTLIDEVESQARYVVGFVPKGYTHYGIVELNLE